MSARPVLLPFVSGALCGGILVAALLPPARGVTEPDMRPTVATLERTAMAWGERANLAPTAAVCRPDGRCAVTTAGRPVVAFCDVLGCDLECAEVSDR